MKRLQRHRLQSQPPKECAVVIYVGIIGRQQRVANTDRVGTGEQTESLHLVAC